MWLSLSLCIHSDILKVVPSHISVYCAVQAYELLIELEIMELTMSAHVTPVYFVMITRCKEGLIYSLAFHSHGTCPVS